MIQARTFRFQTHALDIRQNARTHEHALQSLSGESKDPAASRAILDDFMGLARLQQKYPSEALPAFIISGTTSAEDLKALLRLAEITGIDLSGFVRFLCSNRLPTFATVRKFAGQSGVIRNTRCCWMLMAVLRKSCWVIRIRTKTVEC